MTRRKSSLPRKTGEVVIRHVRAKHVFHLCPNCADKLSIVARASQLEATIHTSENGTALISEASPQGVVTRGNDNG